MDGQPVTSRTCWLLLLCIGAVAPMSGFQARQAASVLGNRVEGQLIVGLPRRLPQVLDRSDLATLPHTTKMKDAQGKSASYRGVLMSELFARVGLNLREPRSLGSYVMIEAVEEPHILFALAEFDTTLGQKRVILADSKDGRPMLPPEGPFRVIVSNEQKPTRWVRQVWAIYVVPDS